MNFLKNYKANALNKLNLVTPFPETYQLSITESKAINKNHRFVNAFAISIALVVTVMSSLITLGIIKNIQSSQKESTPNSFNPIESANFPVIPWDEKTNYEKYNTTYYLGIKYIAFLDIAPVNSDYIGSSLGQIEMLGYDEINDSPEKTKASIFSVVNFDVECCICAKFDEDDNYYLYMNPSIAFSSFNEFITKMNLIENVNISEINIEKIMWYEDGSVEKISIVDFDKEALLNEIFLDNDEVEIIKEFDHHDAYYINLEFYAFNNPIFGGYKLFRIHINPQNEISFQLMLGNYSFKLNKDLYGFIKNLETKI